MSQIIITVNCLESVEDNFLTLMVTVETYITFSFEHKAFPFFE